MKIAIVKLSALGDIVHAMVVLQFIKNSNQKILVDWIVDDTYQQLLESNPDINKIHVINIKKAKKKKSLYMLINELIQTRKMGPYDLVIDMQGLIKSAIISWMIPSSVTLGFDQSSIREGIASIFYNKTFKFGYEKNVIERNIALINFALGSYINSDLVQHKLPFLYSINKHVFNGLSKRKKNILIIPGASNTSKCYPSLKFAELSNLLDANIIISWGSKNEKKLADEIKFQSEKVIVSDNLSLESLISLISQVDLVIGADTGPTHMAWALNIPSITLYGSTPGYRNSLITKVNKKIESNSEVNPFKINREDKSIMEISTKEILKLSQKLLS